MRIFREFVEFPYTPSSGSQRVMKLELLKLTDKSGKIYYTVMVENRPLVALSKWAARKTQHGVSKEEYRNQFQVKPDFFSKLN